jgi:His/Glu/Gln/Arg/opine family amino acid ABC transporter permease subunit
MGFDFDISVVFEHLPYLLGGLGLTLVLTGLTMVLGGVFGLMLCFLRMSHFKLFRVTAMSIIEFIRNTPSLVHVMWVFYALPFLTGIDLSGFTSGLIALTAIAMVYLGEMFRSGIQAIGKPQTEGALALGMSYFLTMKRVVLPQAFRNLIPGIMTLFVETLKLSAICSFISVTELMYRGVVATGWTYRPFEIYTVVGLMYVMVAVPISLYVSKIEKRLRRIYG